MDLNFSQFFGFKFWVIFPYFKRGQLPGSRHLAVVIIAPALVQDIALKSGSIQKRYCKFDADQMFPQSIIDYVTYENKKYGLALAVYLLLINLRVYYNWLMESFFLNGPPHP